MVTIRRKRTQNPAYRFTRLSPFCDRRPFLAPRNLPRTRCVRRPSPRMTLDYRQESCRMVVEGLEAIGIQYFIHVPDSFGAPVISHFESQPEVRSFPVAKEEEGIGIAAGLAMAGKKCVLFYQDTGLGNSIGAITTYAAAYHVPMLLLAVRRGGFGEFNAANFHFSETAVDMVDSMRIKSFVLDYKVPLNQWPPAIKQAYDYCHMTHRPIVMFLNLKD